MSYRTKTPALATLLALLLPGLAHGSVLDPTGDTFGVLGPQIDLTLIKASSAGGMLSFEVHFAGPVAPASDGLPESVIGYIAIDTDQDTAPTDLRGLGWYTPGAVSGMGYEYFIDLYDIIPGLVDLVDSATLSPAASAPITFDTTSLSVAFPLSDLGGDDGLLNYGIIVGTFAEETDQAFGAIPEPSGLVVWASLCALSVVAGRAISGPRALFRRALQWSVAR